MLFPAKITPLLCVSRRNDDIRDREENKKKKRMSLGVVAVYGEKKTRRDETRELNENKKT